jgi:hypothetical protein
MILDALTITLDPDIIWTSYIEGKFIGPQKSIADWMS